MKRIYQVTSLIFAGIGIFMVLQGIRLKIVGQLGPGPGFFPFWIGVLLTSLSAVWLVQVTLGPAIAVSHGLLPPRRDLLRLAAVVLALIAFMLLLRPLGFNLSMLALLLFLFFAIDRKHAIAKIVVAFLGSFGVHHLFEQGLRVPLPFASIPFLQQLGL